MSPRRALPALLAMLTAAVMAIWSLVPGSGSTAVVGAAVSPPAAAPREVRLSPAIERLPVELSRSRADAAGIEGRTFACRGRIWEGGEHGPPGVRVELGVVTAEEALVLAEVTSGPRGRFEGGLAVPDDLAERKDARLFARVALEGHPRRLWRAPLPETGREAVFHLSLVLQNLLAGRVVDSAGRPVRDASVEACAARSARARRTAGSDSAASLPVPTSSPRSMGWVRRRSARKSGGRATRRS